MFSSPLLSIRWVFVLIAVLALIYPLFIDAVDRSKFRTCDQTGFCKRLRANQFENQQYHFNLDSVSLDESSAKISFGLLNGAWPLQDPLDASISILVNGIVRFHAKESKPLHGPRYEVKDVLQQPGLEAATPIKLSIDSSSNTVIASYHIRSHPLWPTSKSQPEYADRLIPIIVTIHAKPFSITITVDGTPLLVANHRNLLQFEQHRERNPKPAPPVVPEQPQVDQTQTGGSIPSDNAAAPAPPAAESNPSPPTPEPPQKFPYDIDGMWEESFNGHMDSKPKGPSAVALDVSFLGMNHVYGIPEHAAKFSLKGTRNEQSGDYSDPYRLYNLDVFEYELDNPMALYGAVPFMMGHNKNVTAGFFWLNTAETFIDVTNGPSGAAGVGSLLSSLFGGEAKVQKDSHWMSESGVIDAFFFPGPTAEDVWRSYATLTGYAPLPPRFSTAYHQCRWNYKNEDDVKAVDGGFDEHDIPYDVLWLDIEHTDGKKYFTWDKSSFPTPRDMQKGLADHGRKMVTIVDPHIKRDHSYSVHTNAESNGYYIKNSNKKGGDYEGWCWPGSVSYLDFVRPDVREYWSNQFGYSHYEGSTNTLYIWNDMNEPSVFNGPEVTMPKDNLHLHGLVEHRDVHNQYGFYHQWATEQGLIKREENKNQRPFVLTRSFFSGSQQYGAVWTGDNKAAWSHLQAAQPMLLSLNIAGITFSGADVGGFFGDPDTQLLVRWYQAGAYHPFFRGHAHIDTKRREPWLFGEPTTSYIRDAIRARYAILPYIYTLFYQSSVTGVPIMRPLWSEFPRDINTFETEDSFMLGNALLIRPITDADIFQVNVYLPSNGPNDQWFSITPDNVIPYPAGQITTVFHNLAQGIPVFQRGGTIIPRRERARRSSALMDNDPITLIIAVDKSGSASGSLYFDDGISYDYTRGAFIFRLFQFNNNQLTNTAANAMHHTNGAQSYVKKVFIERIVLVGISSSPSKISLIRSNGEQNDLTFFTNNNRITIRKPDVAVNEDFTIKIE